MIIGINVLTYPCKHFLMKYEKIMGNWVTSGIELEESLTNILIN